MCVSGPKKSRGILQWWCPAADTFDVRDCLVWSCWRCSSGSHRRPSQAEWRPSNRLSSVSRSGPVPWLNRSTKYQLMFPLFNASLNPVSGFQPSMAQQRRGMCCLATPTTMRLARCQTGSNESRSATTDGFIIASGAEPGLSVTGKPFRLKMNGWGQIRHTEFDSKNVNPDVNQFQLKRARLIFSGNAFSPDLAYHVQLDGAAAAATTCGCSITT